MAIELDARRIANLRNYTDNVGALLQSELQYWRNVLGPRKVTSLEVHYFGDYLEPYEITGIIHRLSTEFEIQAPVYRVIFEPEEADADVLALFKGLSFHHCQFSLEHLDHQIFDVLEKPFNDAKSFCFPKVGLQVKHSESMENLTKNIKFLHTHFKPDYIYVGGSTYKLSPKEIESQHTLFEGDLCDKKLDYLSIGPQAHSQFNGQKIDSLTDTRRYVTAIQSGRLPINQPEVIQST